MEYILCEHCGRRNDCNKQIDYYIQVIGEEQVEVWRCKNYIPTIKVIDRVRLRDMYYNNHNLEKLVERLMREDKRIGK